MDTRSPSFTSLNTFGSSDSECISDIVCDIGGESRPSFRSLSPSERVYKEAKRRKKFEKWLEKQLKKDVKRARRDERWFRPMRKNRRRVTRRVETTAKRLRRRKTDTKGKGRLTS